MKKLIAILCSIALCISCGAPAFAASNLTDDVNLSEGYIAFSEQLAAKGIVASTCLEDFIYGYQETTVSLQQYIDALIEAEIIRAAKIEATVADNLQLAAEYADVEPYSLEGEWYDDIGVYSPALTHNTSYSRHKLYLVEKGDIIYETEGSTVTEFLQHIAVVEGTFYDTRYQQYYIRTVEAVKNHVSHGVLEDSRYEYRGIYVYRVAGATLEQRTAAVNFMISQLGKPWDLDVFGKCNYGSDTKDWYCSELAWAAYYNQGINLNGDAIPGNPYRPAELAASSLLISRDVE